MRSSFFTVLTGASLALTAFQTTFAAPAATPSSAVAAQLPFTLKDSFLYDLDNESVNYPTVTSSHGVKITSSVYIVDGEGTGKDLIAEYKKAGKKVVCYFSAGSFEGVRKDADAFTIPSCFCGKGQTYNKSTQKCSSSENKLDGWKEYWLNIRDTTCLANIEPIMRARMQSFKDKGCDGVDPDNVDSYSNEQTYGTTPADQVAYLNWIAKTAHDIGLSVDLKNSGDLVVDYPQLATLFDFSVIESCNDYDECDKYQQFLTLGKPQIRIEYGNEYTCSSMALPKGVTGVQYDEDSLDSTTINTYCVGA